MKQFIWILTIILIPLGLSAAQELSASKSLAEIKEENLSVELIKAVTKRNNHDQVLKLLENGASIYYEDQQGLTAFHWALVYGHKEYMNTIIEKAEEEYRGTCADNEETDQTLKSIRTVDDEISNKRLVFHALHDCRESLFAEYDRLQEPKNSVWEDKIEEQAYRLRFLKELDCNSVDVRCFIEKAIPALERRVNDGWAFLKACNENNTVLMEELLKMGVSPNLYSRDGSGGDNTFLTALVECNDEIVHLLLSYGIEVNHWSGGETPLSHACCLYPTNRFDYAQLLLEAESSLEIVVGRKSVPLTNDLSHDQQKQFYQALARASIRRYVPFEESNVKKSLKTVWAIIYHFGILREVPAYPIFEILNLNEEMRNALIALKLQELKGTQKTIRFLLVDDLLATDAQNHEIPAQIRQVADDKFDKFFTTLLSIVKGASGIKGKGVPAIVAFLKKKIMDDLALHNIDTQHVLENFGELIEQQITQRVNECIESETVHARSSS